MCLESGNHELVVSVGEAASVRQLESMRGAEHWVNHILINPADSRFLFLHRWQGGEGGFRATQLATADPDGSALWVSALEGGSHFDWRDDGHILIWGKPPAGEAGYTLVEDRTDRCETIGRGVLTRDGHMSYSPDGRWLVTDEYPDAEERRTLILYRLSDGERIDLGRFLSPRKYSGEIRCDLHPRWSRDGRFISIDSLHEGTRQIYVLDISGITESEP
jgi:hypothetical protein